MTIQEINRRLSILNKKEIPKITARDLRKGMEGRLQVREIMRFGGEVTAQKARLQNRLHSLIEQEKQAENLNDLPAFSTEPLEEFNEPIFRRIRKRGGFF